MKTTAEYQAILDQWITEQATLYPVMVDGNSHRELPPVKTKKETITRVKCQEMARKIAAYLGKSVERLEIYMDQYAYNEITARDIPDILAGDVGVRRTIKKTAYYIVSKDRLTIYENSTPVYLNDHGSVCTDVDALCDSLC